MLLVLIFKNTISIQLSASTYSLATITDSLDITYNIVTFLIQPKERNAQEISDSFQN